MTVRQTSTATTMRSLNRSAILNVLREHSPISRTEIATRVNASQPTVKRVLDDLIRDDFGARAAIALLPGVARPPCSNSTRKRMR